jgi:hypothetical protein
VTKVPSRTRGIATVIETTDGARALMVTIEIDCGLCGQHTVRFAGHHLQAIRDVLIEFIDLHPDLMHDEAERKVIERLTFKAPSNDPSTS